MPFTALISIIYAVFYRITKRAIGMTHGRSIILGDKKPEMIKACLEVFVTKGLKDTTSRDLAKAMKLQNGGLYYYFTSKDEAVIACAEAATMKLEEELLYTTIKEFNDPDRAIANLHERADRMSPYMRFVTNVCSLSCYDEAMKPVLDRLAKRYDDYAGRAAKLFGCPKEVIEPDIYMAITTVSNYMIFGGESYIAPQMEMLKKKMQKILQADYKQNADNCYGGDEK